MSEPTGLQSPPEQVNPKSTTPASQQALEAWKKRFIDRQVTLDSTDPTPFIQGRVLGGGGVGIVYETTINGIAVAWKRTYSRKLTKWHLNEAEVLAHLSENRHRHIVQLIGSYIHRQRGIYELGLLLWPVAECDLAFFLQEFDNLLEALEMKAVVPHSNAVSSMKVLAGILDLTFAPGSSEQQRLGHTWVDAHIRLRKIFGCASEAVAYLHKNGIRHKDIKPSQILLSRDGIWLTDFGWSKNVSEMTNSLTSGGDTITPRYHAPERTNRQSCGRSEDIFSLGCTFLEILFRLKNLTPTNCPTSRFQDNWSYQGQLEHITRWIHDVVQDKFDMDTSDLNNYMLYVVYGMLVREPTRRMNIETVLEYLRARKYSIPGHFGSCCMNI